jgi:hypothetical protein
MRTAFRDPDDLTIKITRHPQRNMTSVEVLHGEAGLSVVIWDDWSLVSDPQLPDWLRNVVSTWMRVGPLAAHMAAGQKVNGPVPGSPRPR